MPPLGCWIRLSPLKLGDLPSHAAFKTAPADDGQVKHDSERERRPELLPFAKALLDEAREFVNVTLPATFQEGALKSSPPAAAKVRLLRRDISKRELSNTVQPGSDVRRESPWNTGHAGEEAWFARRSIHENSTAPGTATFDEFDWGLRVDHSEHEREYSLEVFDSYKVIDWGSGLGDGADLEGYSNVTMSLYEMCHELPFPLLPRVFPLLVVTAKTGRTSSLIIQIPVDLTTLDQAFYSNGRNLREGDSKIKRKRPILGAYTSVEQCRITGDQKIEWIMATASDAKGWIPSRVQKLGVAGPVVKDVGLLIGWISNRRKLHNADG